MINKNDLKVAIGKKILSILEFLKDYEVISNVNLCDFLLNDHWNRFIPKNFEKSFLLINDDLHKLPSGILDIPEIKLGADEDIKCFTKHPTLKVFVEKSCSLSLKNFEPIKKYENFKTHDEVNDKVKEFYSQINSFMGEKKLYEVPIMADVCNHLCNKLGTNKVVDIGGGLGYLGIYLATVHGCEVVSVEQVLQRTEAADKRYKLFKKQWKSILKKTLIKSEEKVSKTIGDCQQSTTSCNNTTDPKTTNKTFFEDNLSKGSFKSVSYTINHSDDFDKLCQECSLETSEIVLTGLHACGDLSSNMLHFFVENPHIKGICLVGCCYNLITESSCPTNGRTPGFPMSHLLKSQSVFLGDYLKLLACQSPFKTASDVNYTPPKSLYWRALLQLILVEKLHNADDLVMNETSTNEIRRDSNTNSNIINNNSKINSNTLKNVNKIDSNTLNNDINDKSNTRKNDINIKTNTKNNDNNIKNNTTSDVMSDKKEVPPTIRPPVWRVGKVAEKCQTFDEYVQKCLKKLRLDIDLSKDDLDGYMARYEGFESKCLSFYYSRCCLGQCVEALIQLDRMLFLLERDNIKDVSICELFDPCKSPRCYALIANK